MSEEIAEMVRPQLTRRQALLASAMVAISPRCASAQTSSPLTPLRVASTPNDDVTPALYALHNDLFRKAGIDVQLSAMSNGSAVSAAVAGGATDIGRSSMLPLIAAHSRGIDFALIAPSGLYSSDAPIAALVVPINSTVRSARDLNGKIVSVPALGDLDSVGLRTWVDAGGGDSKAVQYVEMPGSAVLAELTNGRVVAGTLQNPYLAQALKSGAVRVLGYHISAIGTHLLQSSWFTTGAFLEKNPASVRAFAQVLDAASIYCNAHQPQTVDLLASYTKIDPTVIASMVRTNFAPSLDPAQIQPLINAAAKYKVITRSFEAREFIARLS